MGVPQSGSPRNPFSQDQEEAVSMAVVGRVLRGNRITLEVCLEIQGTRLGHEGRELIMPLTSTICSPG